MNNKKRILYAVLSVVVIIIIIIITNIVMNNSPINNLQISIHYPTTDTIIDSQDINSIVNKNYGNVTKKKRKEIDTKILRDELKKNMFIDKANVYLSLSGVLKIDITQRNAIARVFTKKGYQYYIDKDMYVIPSQQKKAANVPIVYGDINEVPKDKIDSNVNKESYIIFRIAKIIQDNPNTRYDIDEIYKDKDRYELYSKTGNIVINLGNKDNVDDGLKKLRYVYSNILVKYGWDKYSQIDV